MSSSLFQQVVTIAMRSIRRTIRQPHFVFPSIAFPLLLLAINSQGFSRATDIPNFPGDSYLAFLLAVPYMQAALFAATNAGGGIAEDIEKGFLNRLSLTPMRGPALVLGQLAGAVSVAVVASTTYTLIGLACGVEIRSDALGVLVIIVLATINSLAFAGIGALLALRTGSGEAVQGLFPLLFVSFFLSSMNMPRDLIAVDWFRTVADWNPVSYMVEGVRSLIITGWDGRAIAIDLVLATTIIVVTLAACGAAMRTRLVRA